ncbi:hypothetical protein LTS10_004505 [Elasticomyces elasticus]|nr:hypothetical protein LTS10_004505 [Elasticomyces elasticus]
MDNHNSEARRVMKKTIGQQLEHDSCRVLTAWNASGLQDPDIFSYLHPHFHARFEKFPYATNSTEQAEVISACTSVDLFTGHGVVWVTLGMRGIPQCGFENVRREAVVITTWQRQEDEKWLMVEQSNVRGPGRGFVP